MHRNIIDLQRAIALKKMGEEARKLLQEGYAVESDRILDELIERKKTWEK